MKILKILISHLVLWFFISAIIQAVYIAIYSPDISLDNIDFDKISEEIPSSFVFISVSYLLIGWIIPYKYFNKKSYV